ncbi:hypothetical protein SESBI_16668 [Sesbania bispinosa]|nr:hypothetical protein SESBI_16668 [Sesbania bispinosa]
MPRARLARARPTPIAVDAPHVHPSSPILSASPFTNAPFITIPNPSDSPPKILRIVSVRCKANRREKMEENNENTQNIRKEAKEKEGGEASSTSRKSQIQRLTSPPLHRLTPLVAFSWPQCRSTSPEWQNSSIPSS